MDKEHPRLWAPSRNKMDEVRYGLAAILIWMGVAYGLAAQADASRIKHPLRPQFAALAPCHCLSEF